MSVEIFEKRFSGILSAIGFQTREERQRLYAKRLEERIIYLQFVLPENNPLHEKLRDLSTSVSIEKEDIERLESGYLRNLLKEELDGSSGYQIQARCLPENGAFLAVKERRSDIRLKFYLNGDLNVHTSLERKEKESVWEKIKDLPGLSLGEMENLITLALSRLPTEKPQLLTVPLK